MKNSDMPSMPSGQEQDFNNVGFNPAYYGLTKREQACISLGTPETGDEELDAIIKKSERKRIASKAMMAYLNGQLSWTNGVDGGYTPPPEEAAKEAVNYADALLAELGK